MRRTPSSSGASSSQGAGPSGSRTPMNPYMDSQEALYSQSSMGPQGYPEGYQQQHAGSGYPYQPYQGDYGHLRPVYGSGHGVTMQPFNNQFQNIVSGHPPPHPTVPSQATMSPSVWPGHYDTQRGQSSSQPPNYDAYYHNFGLHHGPDHTTQGNSVLRAQDIVSHANEAHTNQGSYEHYTVDDYGQPTSQLPDDSADNPHWDELGRLVWPWRQGIPDECKLPAETLFLDGIIKKNPGKTFTSLSKDLCFETLRRNATCASLSKLFGSERDKKEAMQDLLQIPGFKSRPAVKIKELITRLELMSLKEGYPRNYLYGLLVEYLPKHFLLRQNLSSSAIVIVQDAFRRLLIEHTREKPQSGTLNIKYLFGNDNDKKIQVVERLMEAWGQDKHNAARHLSRKLFKNYKVAQGLLSDDRATFDQAARHLAPHRDLRANVFAPEPSSKDEDEPELEPESEDESD